MTAVTAVATAAAVSVAAETLRDRSIMGILDLSSRRRPRGVLATSPGASSVDASGDGLC